MAWRRHLWRLTVACVLAATLCSAPRPASAFVDRFESITEPLEDVEEALRTWALPGRVWSAMRFQLAIEWDAPWLGLIRDALDSIRWYVGLSDWLPRFEDTRLSVVPIPGVKSSPFGLRRDPINHRRRFHHGLDLVAERGTIVRAAGSGVVTDAHRRGGYGRVVVIDHGRGLESRYAHLQRLLVDEGDWVTAGTPIATVGSSGRTTGPHLHFEVRVNGAPINPAWKLAALNRVPEQLHARR